MESFEGENAFVDFEEEVFLEGLCFGSSAVLVLLEDVLFDDGSCFFFCSSKLANFIIASRNGFSCSISGDGLSLLEFTRLLMPPVLSRNIDWTRRLDASDLSLLLTTTLNSD